MGFPKNSGTNLFGPELVSSGVKVALTDEVGDAILVKCVTGSIPSAVAGYAVGCILINTTSGMTYYNSGTAASATFSALA